MKRFELLMGIKSTGRLTANNVCDFVLMISLLFALSHDSQIRHATAQMSYDQFLEKLASNAVSSDQAALQMHSKNIASAVYTDDKRY